MIAGHLIQKIVLLLVSCSLLACYVPKEWEPVDKDRVMPEPVSRQLAPEPPYGTTRFERAPVVQPSDYPAAVAEERVLPMIHLSLKNVSMKQAAMQLASAADFHSYCASSIEDKRVTYSSLGNIDELAAGLAGAADIQVIVDHANREIRFLSAEIAPVYDTDGVLPHESQ